MILREMFEAQRKLDNHIIEEHKLQDKDLFNNKVVAFIVELGECSNEVRFFKHWSNKGPSKREIILEEFVDIFHFGLSLGNDLNNEMVLEHLYTPRSVAGNLCEDFIKIVAAITQLQYEKDVKCKAEYIYIELMEHLLGFAYKLGFNWKDIEMAYYKKNAVNHKRQETGY